MEHWEEEKSQYKPPSLEKDNNSCVCVYTLRTEPERKVTPLSVLSPWPVNIETKLILNLVRMMPVISYLDLFNAFGNINKNVIGKLSTKCTPEVSFLCILLQIG